MFLPLLSPLPGSYVADFPMRLVNKDDQVTGPNAQVKFRPFGNSYVFVLRIRIRTSRSALANERGTFSFSVMMASSVTYRWIDDFETTGRSSKNGFHVSSGKRFGGFSDRLVVGAELCRERLEEGWGVLWLSPTLSFLRDVLAPFQPLEETVDGSFGQLCFRAHFINSHLVGVLRKELGEKSQLLGCGLDSHTSRRWRWSGLGLTWLGRGLGWRLRAVEENLIEEA